MQSRMTACSFTIMDMALCDRIWLEGWDVASFSGRSAAKIREEPQICEVSMSARPHGYLLFPIEITLISLKSSLKYLKDTYLLFPIEITRETIGSDTRVVCKCFWVFSLL